MNWLNIKYKLKEIWHIPYNIYMIVRFPFLRPKIGYFGQYNWYRCIPIGWRKSFGIQLCKEIKQALKRYPNNEFIITDIKEKYGSLNIYEYGSPDEVHDIINKYEYISAHTCIECGRIATRRSKGYILPYCNDCEGQHVSGYDEYYKDYSFYGWTKH
jgi:hypothetical protein